MNSSITNPLATENGLQESLASARERLEASKNSVIFFDISSRDELTLTGQDRQTFLHGFCTNHIKRLVPQTGCEAFITTIQGKTLGHIFVFAEEQQLILDTVPQANVTLLPHLDRYLITEDVQLQETQDLRSLFYLTGPNAANDLSNLCGLSLTLEPFQSATVELQGLPVVVRRVDFFRQPGFQLRVKRENHDSLSQRLEQSGIMQGSQQLWEMLRVRDLFPQFGVDFSAQQLAQEVDRTEQAISFHKGCYLGQEPIARIDALGHVNRLLRGLQIVEWPESSASLMGAQLFAAADANKSIGEITSAVTIPALPESPEESFALTLIRREFSEPGTQVVIRQGSVTGIGIVYQR